MTRKDINRYIESLLQEAKKKVNEECEAKRDQRIKDLTKEYALESFTRDLRDNLEPLRVALEYLTSKMSKSEKLQIENYYSAPLNRVSSLVNQLTPSDFLYDQFRMDDSDPVLIEIRQFERKSVSEVINNYNALRQNTQQMTPQKAIEYLKELGFELPEEDIAKSLMKPLDPRFLIVKAMKEEE